MSQTISIPIYVLHDTLKNKYWASGWNPWGDLYSAKLYRRRGDATSAFRAARKEFAHNRARLERLFAHGNTAFPSQLQELEVLVDRLDHRKDAGLEVITLELVGTV